MLQQNYLGQEEMPCHPCFFPVLGLLAGFTLGFLFGLKFTGNLGASVLALFLCLGASTFTFHGCYRERAGLGVDDMFALVTSLENLSEEEASLPIDQRMGLVRTS